MYSLFILYGIILAVMARQESEKPEIPTEKDLKDLRYKLAHISVDAVRRTYDEAYRDCRMIYDRLAAPKQIQTLVQIWKQP